MTKPPTEPPVAISGGRCRWVAVTAALVTALCAAPLGAQAPAAPTAAAAPSEEQELEQLVGRIALYPDDLVGIILPASTNPLQIVQADRYLEKRKQDPKAPIDEKWDDPVKALLNYPDIVKMMSQDLDWTAALGEAVAADTAEVMEAVQAFRRRTQSAGNLKTDDKQTVVVEKEVIKIVPSNPEVIYVPQYNPTTVVYAGYSWGYYPSPYPVYYYPYAPGAAFAAGIVWGAAIGAIWNGGRYGCGWGGGGNNTINIDRNTNINVGGGDRTNIGGGGRDGGGRGGAQTSQWKSNKSPGQVSSSVGKTPSSRVGDSRGGASGGARPSTQQAGIGGAGADRGGAGGGARPSTQPSGGMGADRGGAGADRGGAGGAGAARPSTQPSGGAFNTGSSGRQTSMDSSRGASSRSSSAGARAAPSGGGARSGGGGSRGGGGGRGGGGRR